jgi:hypothetical protein
MAPLMIEKRIRRAIPAPTVMRIDISGRADISPTNRAIGATIATKVPRSDCPKVISAGAVLDPVA